MTLNTTLAYIKVLAQRDNPFYAADLHIDGGTMSALATRRLVRKTGNTKEVMVHIYDDMYKQVTVYEWSGVAMSYDLEQLKRVYTQAKQAVEAYEQFFGVTD